MLTYLYFGILIVAVAIAISQIRRARRNGEALGLIPQTRTWARLTYQVSHTTMLRYMVDAKP